MGTRRARSRRDVELQLGDLVADRYERHDSGIDPAAKRWARPRLERRTRGGSPTAGARSFLSTPSQLAGNAQRIERDVGVEARALFVRNLRSSLAGLDGAPALDPG